MEYTKQVKTIVFGIASAEEIRNSSVCEVNDPRKMGYNTVYDPRMGTTDSTEICETCKENAEDCTGHFGHISLNVPIIHPLYYRRVLNFLMCICSMCYRFILVKDQLAIGGFLKYKNDTRFGKILEKVKKTEICCHSDCGKDHPKFRFTSSESKFYKIYEEKNKNKISVQLTTEEIQKIFDNVPDEDVVLMGFDPKLMHPRNLILTDIPVIPPCARPYVKADGKICDDDLTNQYIEIVKCNNSLAEVINQSEENKEVSVLDASETSTRGRRKKAEVNETKRETIIANLRFRIQTTWNNTKKKAKHTTSNRVIKCIKQRLIGKEGLMRNNLLGKRALVAGTPVLMWSGEVKPVEEIQKGDQVVGEDGKPRNVVYTCSGTSQLYKVQNIHDNTSYTVSDEHLITVMCTQYESMMNGGAFGIFAWLSMIDVINSVYKSKGLTEHNNQPFGINSGPLLDIHVGVYHELPESVKGKLLGIKLSKPVDWDYEPVSIKPYIRGLWIGFRGNMLELVTFLNEHDIKPEEIGGISSLIEVDKTDHTSIPHEYMVNVASIRYELLGGLCDSMGMVKNDNQVLEFSVPIKQEHLIREIKFLASSLGMDTFLTTTSVAHVLVITGSNMTSIRGLKTLVNTGSDNDGNYHPILVTKVNTPGKYYGFEVDKTHRFLLGDFTITHNCNRTGRTVIGPDPTVRVNEVVIPQDIADILRVPEKVNSHNIERLQELVNSGQVHSLIKPDEKTVINLKKFRKGTRLMHGDIIHRAGKKLVVETGRDYEVQEGDRVERDGEFLKKLKPANSPYRISEGWTVNKPIYDGLYMIINRQPSLWAGSMMGMRVRIRPEKTIRFNLGVCKNWNADFDGNSDVKA